MYIHICIYMNVYSSLVYSRNSEIQIFQIQIFRHFPKCTGTIDEESFFFLGNSGINMFEFKY